MTYRQIVRSTLQQLQDCRWRVYARVAICLRLLELDGEQFSRLPICSSSDGEPDACRVGRTVAVVIGVGERFLEELEI